MQAEILLNAHVLIDEDASIIEMLMPLLILGILIFVSYRGLKEWFIRTRGKYLRRNYVVIIGMSRIAMQLASQLLAQGRKVSVIAPGKLSSDAEMLRKKGAFVLASSDNESSVLEKAGLRLARTCVIAGSSDKENLALAELIRELKRKQRSGHRLNILVRLQNISTVEIMKDYLLPASEQGNSELIPFNEKLMAARQVYDLNPPYAHLKGEARLGNKECICVMGLNTVAELFLVETSILSQYPDERKLKVIVLANDAAAGIKSLLCRRPYLSAYLDIIPAELINATFSPSPEWSPELINLLPVIDAVYCFDDDDSELFLRAMHFRQFLYSYTQEARRTPFTLCLPQATNIGYLLRSGNGKKSNVPSVNDLNFHIFHEISDTCTVRNLIDENEIPTQLAMAVNYYYSARYDFAGILRDEFRQTNTVALLRDIENKISSFRPKTNAPLVEFENMVIETIVAFTKNSAWKIRRHFGIHQRWDVLTKRKKDANHYVVRDIGHKLHFLERSGAKDLSKETIEKQFSVIAPMEHKRWSAEKYAAGFTSGELPADDKMLRTILKDLMKVHDQLIEFRKLDKENQIKDLDIFLILPMLLAIQKQLSPP